MTNSAVSSENDPRPHVELNLTLPTDARFAGMVRDLVAHGARSAGCADARALAFGRKVEEAVREVFAAGGADTPVSITIRRVKGPIEVLIGSDRGTRALAIEI